MQKKPHNNKYFNYIRYTSLATQMIILITGGTFGGFYLDKYLNVTPLFTITFSLLSVILSIYIAIKDLIKRK